MAAILTLTLNPALDIFTTVERVEPEHKLRCNAPQFHPGGGGINVARVVHRLGGDVLALFAAGGASGSQLRALIAAEQVPILCVETAGTTRESFTAHELSSGKDFRFVLPGPALAPGEWQACLDHIDALPAPRWLVASGSLPPGVPDDFHARLARAAAARGSQLVVDASGPALAEALAQGVALIKPSLRELAVLTGQELQRPEDQRQACQRIVDQGQARMVALSLGGGGALLVTAQGAWRAAALPVQVQSTIGAGDSFLGALVWALDQGEPPQLALRHAMAAGAAALLTPGTALCDPAQVRRLAAQVQVVPE